MTSLFHFKSKRTHQEGFGLLGVVLTILLVSMTTTSIVMIILSSMSPGQNAATEKKGEILKLGIRAYQLSHGGDAGTFPPALTDLVTDDGVPCTLDNDPLNVDTYLTLQGWCGAYLDTTFLEDPDDYQRDGWGTLFGYEPATGEVTSCGPNRSCGDADDILYSQ